MDLGPILRRLAPTNFTRKLALKRLAVVVLLIRSTTGITTPSSVCTRKRDEFSWTESPRRGCWNKSNHDKRRHTAAAAHDGRRVRGGDREGGRGEVGGGYSLGVL
ncbi:hypothetical protein F511_08024 [Dorcoceras hygrometricum]|uniref:Uncharacterized protein n=1 Tax=Dorcoceras hygrometricum TaxID=472368 RepID=A0A2Z7D0F8_9LAMI|nr:hypothetical protein F511_08024 [Dorcoceras hygrometricum]